MMSVSQVSAGAAASGYYREEGYYKAGSPEAEQAARWFGKAAAGIGLTGQVDEEKFAAFLEGRAPGGKLMGRYVDGERQHRPGLDLTFSASKSASVAALVIGDERISIAHDEAVRATMEIVEARFIKTRFQQDGAIVTKNSTGIIAGIFRHDTSRALDPNLHSHAVIANMVQNEKGDYTALRNEDVFNNRKLITEIYRSEFEERVNAFGIQTERGRYGEVNIAGISQEVVDQFSKRRQEILASLDAQGLEATPENSARATLATRAAKHKDIDRSELRAAWRDQALEAGMSQSQLDHERVGPLFPGPSIPADQARTPDAPRPSGVVAGLVSWTKPVSSEAPPLTLVNGNAAQAVSRAIEHVAERNSVFTRSELAATALRFGKGVKFGGIDREIDDRLKSGGLYASADDETKLTNSETVALERSILRTWRQSEAAPPLNLDTVAGRSPEKHLERLLKSNRALTTGQKDAIQTALTGKGRYVGVQGFAGTGKTFMMDRLAHYAARNGYDIEGFAPSHQSVQELSSVLGNASTLAKVVTAERTHPAPADNRKTILIVDEASMVSAKDMRSFMNYAERTQAARVVFVGDTQQLDAVPAGRPFAQLQAAGMRTAVMDEIRRQSDKDLRASVYHSIRGEIASAFERLRDNVLRHEDPRQAAAGQYLALSPEDRKNTRVLTPTNTDREKINAAIRDGLKQEGRIARDGVEIHTLVNRQLTDAERVDARNYAPWDSVQSLVSSKTLGLQKGEVYKIQKVDRDGNALIVSHPGSDAPLTLPLEASHNRRAIGKSLVVYEPEKLSIAAGDDIRFRITDTKIGVKNGLRATVTSTADRILRVSTKDGRQLEIDPGTLAARGIDYDYAATTHAVQGETVDKVIVAMNSRGRLTTQKSFYVEISRAREQATMITDNPQRLKETLKTETGSREDALSLFLERWQLKQPENDKPKEQPNQDQKPREENKQPQTVPSKSRLHDEEFERKLQEIEKQAELIRERNRQITR
ncbi:MobF family relaxase [Ruegeria arenilitoris]|uniref:MobF family relaxase n=1 Tax=Ruegeria arenilitoris TaxID=1173585 RepID=UPI0014811DDE|nr:MobF family relaxase [Ruegeria arenilitoris]